jgi:hypothetical protein
MPGTEVGDTNCKHVPTNAESLHRLDDKRLSPAVPTIASQTYATARPMVIWVLTEEGNADASHPTKRPFPRRLPPVSRMPAQAATPAAQPISSSCIGAEVFQLDLDRCKVDCGE